MALEKLAIWCQQFSPLVAVDESESCDTLLLDITGVADLFGGEGSLAERVVGKFKSRGLPVRVAVADTVGAAWAVSHFGLGDGDCEMAVGDGGFCCIGPFSSPESAICKPHLYSLPIAALRVPAETVRLLGALGIHTIGQLAALPRDQLAARFDPQLLRRLDQFTGTCEEVLVAVGQPPVARAQHLWESPVWGRDAIRQVLQRLIQQVCDQLFQRGQGVLRLNCRLDLSAGPAVQVPLGLYQPSADASHLLGLMDLQFERLRLREPVTAMQVTATASDRLEARQLEIQECGFSLADKEEDRRRLAHLVDRLSSRLGRDAVLAPRLLADAVPECAYRLDPLTGSTSSTKRSPTSPRSPQRSPQRSPRHNSPSPRSGAGGVPGLSLGDACLRPLWLNSQPIALPVTAVIPDGPPIRFRWLGHFYEVAGWWGPERIETGWWRGEAPRKVRRDYYRVETTRGQHFWLFRRRDDARWFLHGEFD